MHLTQQSQRQREATTQPLQPMLKRCDITADFARVLDRHPGQFIELKEHQVGERRLRTFNHRGQHCFLAHKAVKKQCGIGQQVGNCIEPPQGHQGSVESSAQLRGPVDRRTGRERCRHECTHRFAGG